MSVIVMLRRALEPMGIAMAQDLYDGTEEKYLVYNVATEEPSSFADNMAKTETTYLQIHFYLRGTEKEGKGPMDYRSDLKQLKSLLIKAGFSYPSVELNTVETDTGMRHICLETNMESEV